MQYQRGLLHQRGHGWGALLKTVGKLAAPVIGQVVGGGGLLEGSPAPQTEGYGIGDSIRNFTRGFVNTAGKLIGGFLTMPDVLPPRQAGKGYIDFLKKVNPVQWGRGLFTDLLKSGAKSALTAVAKTGLDVLENKRSLKDAIKTHGVQAIKNTGRMAMPRIQQKLRARQGDSVLAGMVKRGARKSMKAGYRTGLDVLEKKRSLKQALRTHGSQALATTMRRKKRRRKQKGKVYFYRFTQNRS